MNKVATERRDQIAADLEVADLDRQLTAIKRGWDKLSGTHAARPPYETALGYLRREIYRVARELVRARGKEIARRFAVAAGRVRAKSEIDDGAQLFMWLLTRFEDRLDRATRRLIAHELQYARMHRIPPELVVGFLLQSQTGRSIYDKVRRREVQKWFTINWADAELGDPKARQTNHGG